MQIVMNWDDCIAKTRHLYRIDHSGEVLTYISCDKTLLNKDDLLAYYAKWGGFDENALTCDYLGQSISCTI